MTGKMDDATQSAITDVMDALDRLDTAASVGSATVSGHEIFAAALLASTEAENLRGLAPSVLAEEATAALAFLSRKPLGTHKVAVRASKLAGAGVPGNLTALEILNDDMPFLFDSVLAEIQARGHRIHLALHPIFKTSRSADGKLNVITAPSDRTWDDGRQESYIAIHMERLPEAEGLDLVQAVSAILDEVRLAVRDWKPMLARTARAIRELEAAPPGVPRDQLAEAVQFLKWLENGNFTFLGARDLKLAGDAETGELELVPEAGLGLLRDAQAQVLRRGNELVSMTPEVRRFFFSPNPLIIAKANAVSRVHRRVHMDYIGVKLCGDCV